MKPKTFTLTLAVDTDGVCASQTTAGAGSLSLNGALVGADPQLSAYYTSTTAQQLNLTSAGNLSALTFTVTGKGYSSTGVYNDSISEAITGPNATTVESSNYFLEISDISADGAVGSAVTIGVVDEAISPIIPIDSYAEVTSIQTGVTGTINYTAHYTLSNVYDASVTADWTAVSSDLTTATASQVASLAKGVTALRLIVHSGSDAGAVRMHVAQSRG